MFLKGEFSNRLVQLSLFSAIVYYITAYPVVFEKARKYFPIKFKKTHHLLIFHTFVFMVLMYVLTYFVFDPIVRVVEGGPGKDDGDGDGDGANGICNGHPLPSIENGQYDTPSKKGWPLETKVFTSYLKCDDNYSPSSGAPRLSCGPDGWAVVVDGECIPTSQRLAEPSDPSLRPASKNQRLEVQGELNQLQALQSQKEEQQRIEAAGDITATVASLSKWSKCNIPVGWPKSKNRIRDVPVPHPFTNFWLSDYEQQPQLADSNNILYYCAKKNGKETLRDLTEENKSTCMDDISNAITNLKLIPQGCSPAKQYDPNS